MPRSPATGTWEEREESGTRTFTLTTLLPASLLTELREALRQLPRVRK